MQGDYENLDPHTESWLERTMTNERYFAWVIEKVDSAPASSNRVASPAPDTPEVVASVGVSLVDWPPGPHSLEVERGFAYNLYVVPRHRRQGLARALMIKMQEFCRQRGMRYLSLHATDTGRPLYERLGYIPTTEMRLDLQPEKQSGHEGCC